MKVHLARTGIGKMFVISLAVNLGVNLACLSVCLSVCRENGFCLENSTMIQIQDIFENGKHNIVLKTVKGFHMLSTNLFSARGGGGAN